VKVLGVVFAWRGDVVVAGCPCLFVDAGDLALMLVAEPAGRDRSVRPFASGRGWDVTFRTHPADAGVDPACLRALERLAGEWAGRRLPTAPSSPRSPRGSARDCLRAADVPAGLEVALLLGTTAGGSFRHEVRNAGGSGYCRVELSPRGRGAAGLFEWAIVGELSGAWDADRLAALSSWIPVVAAAASLGQGPVDTTGAAPLSQTLFLDLGEPDGLSAFRDSLAPLAGCDTVADVHLTLPSACLLRCGHCPRPAEWDVPDRAALLPRLEAAVAVLRDAAVAIRVVLTGPDASLSTVFADALDEVAALRPSALRIVTPGTALADRALCADVARRAPDACVTLTLFGPDTATNDALAGRDGAFDELRRAVDSLRRAGLVVDLNLPVLVGNVAVLSPTLEAAAGMGLSVTLLGFVTEPGFPPAFVRANLAPWAAVRDALAALPPHLGRRVAGLTGLPLCVVPPAMRPRAVFPSPRRADAPGEAAACRSCVMLRKGCPGPTAAALVAVGEDGLAPIDA
jgi:hypothetical protein